MEISDLVQALQAASDAYYNSGTPIMSDAEFDALVDELRTLDPSNPFLQAVGAPAGGGEKVKHNVPIGSQEKLKERVSFDRWAHDVMERHSGPGTNNQSPFVIQWKLDGLTMVVYYEKGKFVRAVTRGDGLKGEDVTTNVRQMQCIPHALPEPFSGSIRGEVIIDLSDFDAHFKPAGYTAPRNAASGKTRDTKSSGSLLSHMKMRAFDIYPTPAAYTMETDRVALMLAWGFNVVETVECDSPDDLWDHCEAMSSERLGLDYEVDGVIVRANSVRVQEDMGFGKGGLIPKGQRCIKFDAPSTLTTLVGVEWTMGHTGAHTPTGKVKPVKCGGVTISSVLLNNMDEVGRLDIAIGDTVTLIRAGDVIPKITGVVMRPATRIEIALPDGCIACGEDLVKDGAHDKCVNDGCEGKGFERISSWVRKRNILHLGDTTLRALWDAGHVRSVADLYTLGADTLSMLRVGGSLVGSGADRIIAEIEKSKVCPLPDFMGSLCIPFLGRRQAQKIIDQGIDTLEKFRCLSAEELGALDGFSSLGTKAQAVIYGIIQAERTVFDLVPDHITVIDPEPKTTGGPLAGMSFCLTGKLYKGRKAIEVDIVAAGGEIRSVSKKLDFLVTDDPNSGSSKNKKALSLDVTLIDGETLQAMMGEQVTA